MTAGDIDIEQTTTVVRTAVVLACGIGGALLLAILGALWDALVPTLTVGTLVMGLLVTWLHLYRGSRVMGRRRAGYGRRSQPAGSHRRMA